MANNTYPPIGMHGCVVMSLTAPYFVMPQKLS